MHCEKETNRTIVLLRVRLSKINTLCNTKCIVRMTETVHVKRGIHFKEGVCSTTMNNTYSKKIENEWLFHDLSHQY